MIRYISLLLFIGLAFWGCEEEQQEDTTPPTVSISSPVSGQSVNEIVTISVNTDDNEGINKVEFFIDDSLVFIDSESPYEYQWNTTQYEDDSEHIIKVISYDNSDNSTESQPIMLRVDNETAKPQGGNILSVTYTIMEMIVEWEESTDGDFKDYKVLYSDTENADRDTLTTYTDKSITSHIITEFDPTHENWFWVQVTDTLGLGNIGNGMTNEIDSPPTPSEIYPIESDNGSFIISWSQNNESDFLSYTLYESQYDDMSDQSIVITIIDNIDTSTIISDDLGYYQINTQDIWGLESESNIIGTTNIINGIMYIVGESYNSEGNLTACYWVDGSRVELPGGAWATDIVVVNGTVYTSGTGEASDACYWINETRYDLPGDGGEAEAIAVDGSDVYVAGWYNNGSCYWKNGERINLTTNAESQAFAVGIRSNGDVYVGGYYMNNHHYYIPCFWKNGNRTNLPIPSGGDGEVYDIAIMDGNMRYYAGYVLKTSSFAGYTPTAVYWRHTNRTDLPLGGSTWDIYGAGAYGITIDGDDIYVAGFTDWFEFTGQEETTGGTFPQYWKNSTIYDLEGGPLTNFGTGQAYDIRVADGNVVVAGIATRDPSYDNSMESACYWLNGELNYLVNQYDVPEGLEDWEWSAAKGIFIE